MMPERSGDSINGVSDNGADLVDVAEMEEAIAENDIIRCFRLLVEEEAVLNGTFNTLEIKQRMDTLQRSGPYPQPTPPLFASIYINGQPVYALVDSGSDFSALDRDYATKLGLQITEKEILFGQCTGPKQKITGYCTVTLRASGREYSDIVLYIVDRQSDPFILGRDVSPKIGIQISGVPLLHDDDSKVEPFADFFVIDPGDPLLTYTKTRWQEADRIQVAEQLLKKLEDTVRNELAFNAAIPKTQFCVREDWEIPIDTGNAAPKFQRQYVIPTRLVPAIEEQIALWDEEGIIEPAAMGQWNSALMATIKRSALAPGESVKQVMQDTIPLKKVRVCFDARQLNKVCMDTGPYRVPLISELHDRMAGFVVASAFDLKAAYHNIRIRPQDRYKTAFTWKQRRYQFARAPFGLRQLPGIFQCYMENLFADYTDHVLIYLDDLVIFTKRESTDTCDEDVYYRHCQQLKEVLDLLNEHSLRINVEKSHLFFKRIKVLGHILEADRRYIDPEKVEEIRAIPRPTTAKQVMAFCGATNYLRAFVKGYASLMAPLEPLKHSTNVVRDWENNPDCEKAFVAIKDILSSAPVLHHPTIDGRLRMYCDASNTGISAVLAQETPDGKPRLIGMASKALNAAQRRKSANERELLALVFGLLRFREYLYLNRFTVYSDHKALQHLLSQKHLNEVALQHLDVLQAFDFDVVHLPGVQNILADHLSRLYPDYTRVYDNTPPAKSSVKTRGRKPAMKLITRRRQLDIDALTPVQLQEFVDKISGKTAPSTEERVKLIADAHAEGHFGTALMWSSLWNKGFWWPTMREECEAMAQSCISCLKYNVSRRGYHPPQSIITNEPFDIISVDTAHLPETTTSGMKYVLIVCDLCTRFVRLYPLKDESQSTIAEKLWDVITTFGPPRVVLSDNGKAFCNQVVKNVIELFGGQARQIASWNPRCNGSAERHVRLMKEVIYKCIDGVHKDADLWLPWAQLCINQRISSRTLSSPFSLMFARRKNDFNKVSDEKDEHTFIDQEDLKVRHQLMLEAVYPAIHDAVTKRVSKRDQQFINSHMMVEKLKPGQVVYIIDVNRSSKSESRYVGPYFIVDLVHPDGKAYTLRDSEGAIIERPVPIDQMKVVNHVESNPALLEREYESEFILADRFDEESKTKEFLVKWKGYPNDANTWEPFTNFNDKQIIQNYYDVRDKSIEVLEKELAQTRRAASRAKLNKKIKMKKAILAYTQQMSSNSSSISSASPFMWESDMNATSIMSSVPSTPSSTSVAIHNANARRKRKPP